MKDLFFLMPAIYWVALALVFVIALYAICVSAKVMAKFCFEKELNPRWKPSSEDVKNKHCVKHLNRMMHLGIIGVMLIYLICYHNFWSLAVMDMLLMLFNAFFPIFLLLYALVIIISKRAFKNYYNKNIKKH